MNNEKYNFRLPAPWEPLDAILLVWPNSSMLSQIDYEDLDELYEALVSLLVDYVDIIIVVPLGLVDSVKERLVLMDVPIEYVYLYEASQYSINVRQFGPFVVESASEFLILNGADDDLGSHLFAKNAFPCTKLQKQNIHLSWNDIESNGNDFVLVDLNRLAQNNPSMTENAIRDFFVENTRVVELINLNEFAPMPSGSVRLGLRNQLLCLYCDEPTSPYYASSKMRFEYLHQVTSGSENPMELAALPWAMFVTDDGSECIADYSQFLVVNESVLVPIFDLPTDEDAMEIIAQSFPGFDIFGFPSRSLAIKKTGLFTITQPIPEGVLEPL